VTDRPLDGLRVLSLAEQYPGPYATLLLADLGADVILVERPGSGDPSRQFGPFFSSLNRGKRSIALDLKQAAGRRLLLELCRDADVLLEGFRPGTMARLGLDAATVAEIAPELIYLSLSGFGQDGPYRDRPAHDISYQAVAGLLADHDDRSPGSAPSPHLGDLTSGMFAVIGVLAALHRRDRTGDGTSIDLSMTDGLVSLLTAHLVPVINELGPPTFPVEPGYGIYRSADGHRLALSVAHEDVFWTALCRAVDLPGSAALTSPERVRRRDELVEQLDRRIRLMDRAELDAELTAQDVPYSWINALEDVPSDPQIAARGMIVEVGRTGTTPATLHVRQPLRFAAQGPGPRDHAPGLGQHGREVLLEVGVAPDEIDRLVDAGVLHAPAG
jgi:crotonobetainyl-CoA:carnitine CoA-transferase CaiB-like acyl-CoA transferase